MKKDTRDALARLEAELLAHEELPEIDDEELDALLKEFHTEPEAPEPVTGYRAYNSDKTDEDLDIYSDLVYEEPEQQSTLLLILSLTAIAVSAAALVYMITRVL